MTSLNRKLIRNLLGMKGQVLAIGSVIACGIAMFVMSLSTMESLSATRDRYYQRYRFANVFAGMKRAPESLARRMAEIPGVAQIDPRVVQDVTIDVPEFGEPVIGRLISIPDYGEPILNGLHLRRGRWIEPGHTGEVLVSEAFADAHDLQTGDQVDAILNGRKKALTIVGMAISPEYVYQIRAGEIFPDDARFGLFWMGHRELSAAFDMEGAFNSVSLSLARSANTPHVLRLLDDLIDPYGGLGSYDRSDHASDQYITNEITQLRSMGVVVPIIFLSVAAFLLNVVLSRVITTQREEIAALKAFGYTGREIGWHYVKFVLLIVTAGAILGTFFGAWLGKGMTDLYTQFFRFPVLEYRFNLRVALAAFAVSVASGVLGTLAAVRQAVALPPAEAMRPEPPAQYRPTFIERIGLQRMFSQSARIILRNLERRPLKALLSSLGIAMGVAILIVGSFMTDSVDYVIDAQFYQSQRQDVSVTFVEPLSVQATYEVATLPGVLNSEVYRAVPARLRAGHRSRRVGIMGLPHNAQLFRPLDMSGQQMAIPAEGLAVSRVLAESLGVQLGDSVQVEVLEGERPVASVSINAVLDDFAGLSAYMNIDAVHRLMLEGDNLSGVYLTVDERALPALYRELKDTPMVAGVSIKTAALHSFQETIAENLLRMQAFNVLFASVIAFGVVYNSARISLSERSRELATLRVIGFTRGEISGILLGELAVLTLIAVPLGLTMGYFLAWTTTFAMVDTEMFRIPLVIRPDTYAFAVLVIVIATIVSGLIVRRRLDHLDLIGVLKTRD